MIYPRMSLFNIADGGGNAGGSGVTPGPGDSNIFSSNEPAAPTPPPVTPPESTQPPVVQQAPVAPVVQTAPQAQVLTPQQIAELSSQAAIRTIQQNQPRPPAPQMTQEQFNKAFNVFQVDAQGFQAITGYAPEKPEQVAALNAAFQAVNRQALTMADALINQRLEAMEAKITGQFAPVKTFHEAQFQKQLESDFFTEHADLKDFRPLIETVLKGEMANGRKFANQAELFKFAADKTRSLLPANVLQTPTAPAANGTTPQTQLTTQRRMTTVSTGGQVSTPQTSAAKSSDAQTIFG